MITCLALAASFAPLQWTIAIGGDAMFNGVSVESNPLAAVEDILRSADVAIVNLEIPLTKADTPTPRKTAADRAAKKQFILKGDPGHAMVLKRAGIDLVSTANNHGMDFGARGADEQRRLLTAVGILSAGTGANRLAAERPVRFRSPRGAEVSLTSFLSFMGDSANEICWPATDDSPGIAALKFGGTVDEADKARIRSIVARAERESSYVAIAIHWGLEKKTLPTPYQVALGRAFVDAGADLVIGHHPHVLQGAEIYRSRPIFYSLGNFVSSRPATSAVFVLYYSGDDLSRTGMAPIRMAGRVNRLGSNAAKSELARFEGLCANLRRAYPSTRTTAPKVTLIP